MMAEKMLQQILHRLDHMEKHFDRTETQLDQVNTEITMLKETMATKGDLDALRQSIEQIDKNQQEDILSLLQVMNRKMDTVSESIDYLTQKFIEHDQAIYVLQKRVGTG